MRDESAIMSSRSPGDCTWLVSVRPCLVRLRASSSAFVLHRCIASSPVVAGRLARSADPRRRPATARAPAQRTEADRDRVEALALFAAGRTHERTGGICRGPAMLPTGAALRSAVGGDRPGDHSRGGPAEALRRGRPLRPEGRRSWTDADPLLLRRLVRLSDRRGRSGRAAGPLRKGPGRPRQGQGNRRRRPPADGNGPALLPRRRSTSRRPSASPACSTPSTTPTSSASTSSSKKVLLGEPGANLPD